MICVTDYSSLTSVSVLPPAKLIDLRGLILLCVHNFCKMRSCRKRLQNQNSDDDILNCNRPVGYDVPCKNKGKWDSVVRYGGNTRKLPHQAPYESRDIALEELVSAFGAYSIIKYCFESAFIDGPHFYEHSSLERVSAYSQFSFKKVSSLLQNYLTLEYKLL